MNLSLVLAQTFESRLQLYKELTKEYVPKPPYAVVSEHALRRLIDQLDMHDPDGVTQ